VRARARSSAAWVTGQEADPDPTQNTAVAKVKVTLPPLYPGPDGPEDVNAFLQYARPLRPTTWVPFAHGYEVRIHYGKTILPSTFSATLDGAPVAGFVPVPNRFQKVTIPLHPGVNVLRLRVAGVRALGMSATDVDTLTFVVP
jgi:hypothetical protein